MTADERRPVGGAIRVRIKDQRQGIDTREAAPAADDSPKLAQNRIWCAIVALAVEITAWMQMLTRNGTKPDAGNPNGCGYACSPFRRRSHAPADRSASTSRPRPLGSTWSTTASGSY